MKNKINWEKYEFRASQVHKIMTGVLPTEVEFDSRILELTRERDTLINSNGNKVKWTNNKKQELESLIEKRSIPVFERLPKTMTTELRKIHRAETFGRNFSFTNKYVQKGVDQEEEAITIYQKFRTEVKGTKTFFVNNKKRLSNGWVTGEADLTDTNNFSNCNEGFDTKCSWELETFPFSGDILDSSYESQNQCYIWLSGAEKWTTSYVLVNVIEDLLHKEKMKWYYALKNPEEGDSNYQQFLDKCIELEKRLIFDYDKFISDNPFHEMFISREEWYEQELDIPLEHRVVEKVSTRNEEFISDLKDRIEISRKYLKYLDGL